MPEIVFIMGKSASGKDKIFKAISSDEELKLNTVVMYTTRPKRVGETEGVEYHFVSDEEARKMQDAGNVIEMRVYETVFGKWKYFTANDGQIDLKSGKKYIIIGTLEAYMKFIEFYGKEHFYPVYIEVLDVLRLERAIKRTKKEGNPNYAEVCRRYLADEEDFSEENIARAGIVKRFENNGELEDCISEIKKEVIENVVIGL